MFRKKKTYIATCVLPLNEPTIKMLKKMQLRHIDDIPKKAKYIAFLDDGDACFLTDIEMGWPPAFPHMTMLSYYEGIQVTI